MPFFSVIVPTYNVAQYLGEALDSLLAQTDSDWEAIVVNDGSTDDTPSVMEAYCSRDSRFRPFHKENGGTASAMNEGLKHVRGEWICWLSSDDLFDPGKLALHREWIRRCPDCSFFASKFRELDNTTGKVTDLPLWREVIPGPEWQVIEMLRGNLIHGNSICVHRDTWKAAGNFDPACGYAQDYEMWLRILLQSPVTVIPEYTCTTREEPGLGTRTFIEARFFDSAKACIAFLNNHGFERLFARVDLTDPEQALAAVDRAMDIANSPHSYLYALGPHVGLISRVMEWLWSFRSPGDATLRLRDHFIRRARTGVRSHGDSMLGFVWRQVCAASCTPGMRFVHCELSFRDVARSSYQHLRAQADERAVPLKRYLIEKIGIEVPEVAPESLSAGREAIVANATDAPVDSSVPYGSLRMTTARAAYLQELGWRVLLVGRSRTTFGFSEGIPFIGTPDDMATLRIVRALRPRDALLGISRADAALMSVRSRFAVYQNTPHVIGGGVPLWVLRLARIPIICVSASLRRFFVAKGISGEQVRVVPNSLRRQPVAAETDVAGDERQRRLLFVGHVCHYKGIDIAIRGFEILRRAFPDATFDIAGAMVDDWRMHEDHLLADNWTGPDGEMLWGQIEQDVPGTTYYGELAWEEISPLYARAGLLVIPSRIEETFGLASIEAQAHGCIPVLPRNGGFPETLAENETGFLYDDWSAAGLASTVSRLWRGNSITPDMRRCASNRAVSEFSSHETHEQFRRVLEETPRVPLAGGLMLKCVLLRKCLAARFSSNSH